jgi:hypothetical protein
MLLELIVLGLLAAVDPLRPAVFVLVLSTDRRNALAFLVGWASALSLLFVVAFVALGGTTLGRSSSGLSTVASVLLLAIGVGLLVVSARRRSRPVETTRPLIPGAVLRRLDGIDARKV